MTDIEFKKLLRSNDLDLLVDHILSRGEAPHFPEPKREHVRKRLASKFGVPSADVDVIVVGSAKIGFSLFDKEFNERLLPAFRPFDADSDIDLAVVSQPIFDLIWSDLVRHAYEQPSFPWQSRKLGEYLVHGWLRPDHFPKRRDLTRCDDWYNTFSSLTRDPNLGRRKIRGGLYYNVDCIRRYQLHGLNMCRLSISQHEGHE